MSKTVAILECDAPLPGTRRKNYTEFFTNLLKVGGLPASYKIDSYNVIEKQYPDLSSKPTAILLTGSKFTCYDEDDWIVSLIAYTKKAIDAGIPVVGICFGHQIAAMALGAKTGPSTGGWEVASTDVELTDLGKSIFQEVVELNEALEINQASMSVMQMHRDAVLELPEGTELLARTKSCPIQGFYKKGKVIALQGHPEFDGEYEAELIEARTGPIFSQHDAKEYMMRVHLRNDGPLIAKALVRFIEES